MAQAIQFRYPDNSLAYLTTVGAITQALDVGATALRPDGSAYHVIATPLGFLLDGYTPQQILDNPALSVVAPAAGGGCTFGGAVAWVRIWFTDEIGATQVQDFQGSVDTFKALRPSAVVIACRGLDSSKNIIPNMGFGTIPAVTAPPPAPTPTPAPAPSGGGTGGGSAGGGGTSGGVTGRTIIPPLPPPITGSNTVPSTGSALGNYFLAIGGVASGIGGGILGPIGGFIVGLSVLFGGGGIGLGDAILGVRSMRDAIVGIAQEVEKFVTILAAAIQAVLGALQKIYEKVIKPILDKIEEITSKLGAWLDRILKPYLDLLQRIRQTILDIYGRIFLPIITAIQRIRQALALLRILHVPGVDKLDQKLQRIQGKLVGVIQQLLNRVNDHSGLINTLLTAKMILQRGVFLNSYYGYQGSIQALWWNGQTRRLTVQEQSAIDARRLRVTGGFEQQALNDLLATGAPGTALASSPEEQALIDLLNGR
jgi:hypothetical protein